MRSEIRRAGRITFVLDDGDAVEATYTGTFASLDELTAIPYVLEATITGGSGRYAGASGSFSSQGTANAIEGRAEDTFVGHLRLRAPA